MSDYGNEFDFSAFEVTEIPVTAPGGDKYILRTASAGAAKNHRNAIMRCTKFDKEGNVTGVQDLASVEPTFVAACLWHEKTGKNPNAQIVESWPAPMIKKLYEKVKEISDSNDESPLVSALKTALALDGSPVSFAGLRDFVAGIPDPDRQIKRLVRALGDAEEELKNS